MFISPQSICSIEENNSNNLEEKNCNVSTKKQIFSSITNTLRNKIEVLFSCMPKIVANTACQENKIYLLNKHTSVIIARDFGIQAGEKVKIAIEDVAATIIQSFFRLLLARNTYNYMFNKGSHYKDCSIDLKKYQHFNKYRKRYKSKQFNSLEDMQIFSSLCLQEIKNILGKLNKQEKKFIATINSFSNMILMHRTNDDLIKNGFIIYSNKMLTHKKIKILKSSTSDDDIKVLANNDFVFTTPYFTSRKNKHDSIEQIMSSGIIKLTNDYGKNAYFFAGKASYNGYLTLTDHLHYTVRTYDKAYSSTELYKHTLREIIGFEAYSGNRDVPMFSQKDMRLGIAYHTLYFLRQLKKNRVCKSFCKTTLSIEQPEDFNQIMHTIFNPEFHVPKILAIKTPKNVVGVPNYVPP